MGGGAPEGLPLKAAPEVEANPFCKQEERGMGSKRKPGGQEIQKGGTKDNK